ncbi:MAG: hypothetical protein JWO38_1942 [Gemmataceae bacterium]|nr:hypothetical protein [Gemmataceae bacterium]
MKERTTRELIEALGEDVSRCHRELIASIDAGERDPNGDVHANYEYHARQLIRAIFAFIEAVTFSVKVKAAEYALRHKRPITDAERFFAVDIEHMLSDRGEIVERPAHIRLGDNIRFAFALQEKALGVAKQFDPSIEWWSCLKSSIKVRDRLTHPKFPGDIDVSGDEIVTALKAYKGFSNQAMLYAELRDDKKRAKRKGRADVVKPTGGKGEAADSTRGEER